MKTEMSKFKHYTHFGAIHWHWLMRTSATGQFSLCGKTRKVDTYRCFFVCVGFDKRSLTDAYVMIVIICILNRLYKNRSSKEDCDRQRR